MGCKAPEYWKRLRYFLIENDRQEYQNFHEALLNAGCLPAEFENIQVFKILFKACEAARS